MQKSKWMYGALSAVLLSAVLAGCGNNGNDQANGSASANAGNSTDPDAKTITWLSARPADGAIVQTVKELADKFATEHPGFKLDIQITADRPSYLTKLRTLIAAGNMPEFIDTDADPFAQQLAGQGKLVDMAAFLKDQGVYDKFYEPALKYQELPDGGLYLIPLEYHLEMVWYNKKLFKDNNIQVPQTMDDWLAAAKKLKASGTTPIAVDGTDVWPVLRYAAMLPFRETGNAFIRDLSQGKAKMSGDVGMRAANFVAEMGQYFQKGFATTDYTTAKNLFLDGKAAMYWMGDWELPSFTDDALPADMKGNVGYFYLPMTDHATTPSNEFFGNSGIGLGANADKFDGAAKDFLTYVLKNYSDVYVAKQQMSPIKFEIADESKYSNLYLSVKKDMDNYGSEFAKPWDTLLDADSNTVMGDLVIKLAMGATTPDQFAKEIDSTIASNVN